MWLLAFGGFGGILVLVLLEEERMCCCGCGAFCCAVYVAEETMVMTENWQRLFYEEGFRRLFSRKAVVVEVWRDWDGNRLVKMVNGKVVGAMGIPRNWSDKARGDGRRWVVGDVRPADGLSWGSPRVVVEFRDRLRGVAMERRF